MHEGQMLQDRRAVTALNFLDDPGRRIRVWGRVPQSQMLRVKRWVEFVVSDRRARQQRQWFPVVGGIRISKIGAPRSVGARGRLAQSRFMRPPRELCSRLGESIVRQHASRQSVNTIVTTSYVSFSLLIDCCTLLESRIESRILT